MVEFKAFNLFAFTFGIGMAIQAERARMRGASAELFLVRRFLVLLAFGAIHMTLIANVDILMSAMRAGWSSLLVMFALYSACAMGVAAIYLPTLLPLGPTLTAGSNNAEMGFWSWRRK